jgi:hypothetical protein
MLEQCMESLDHQNYILNEQSEELSLLRAKMRHFEYLMDAFKHSKGRIFLSYYKKIVPSSFVLDGNTLLQSMPGDSNLMDNNNILCCRDL